VTVAGGVALALRAGGTTKISSITGSTSSQTMPLRWVCPEWWCSPPPLMSRAIDTSASPIRITAEAPSHGHIPGLT
jgi:hypothetical protein